MGGCLAHGSCTDVKEMSMKNRKYILFKKAYSTTLENTIEIKTDMQKEYETYRVEYTVQWSTLLPYKGVHDRLIRMLLLC